MLAQIPKRTIALGLFLVGITFLSGCATEKKTVALVSDPDQQKESTIPWNKQEKWESQGQWGNLTDRR